MRKGHDQSRVPVQDKMFLIAVIFIVHQIVIVFVMLSTVALMSS